MNPQSATDTPPVEFEAPELNESPKSGHWLTIASMAVFVILSLAAVAFLYYQNQQLKAMLLGYQVSASPTPSAVPDVTLNWKVFKTDDFSVRYPETLTASESGQKLTLYVPGATPEASGTFVPNITIANKFKKPADFRDLNTWIASNGKTYPNIANSSLVVLGTQKFITFESDSGSSAYSVHYIIDDNTDIFDFSVRIVGSNEEAGKKLLSVLPQILSTLKFIVPTPSASSKPVACTLEAKICPDGSSVGRTGPNCEFAPCPTP